MSRMEGFGVWGKCMNPPATGLKGWLPHVAMVRSEEQKYEPSGHGVEGMTSTWCKGSEFGAKVRTLHPRG